MKRAIDNYELGKQREVSAEKFEESISSSTKRFRCMECGEIVSLIVNKKGSKFFSHKKGKKEECELRVDGASGLTVYERLGLPLYLKKNNSGKFYFSAFFRRVPEKEFLTCKDRNPYIELCSKDYKNVERFYLNGDKFISNHSNFIDIEQLPQTSSKLYIRYSDNYTGISFKKYWSEYINCPLPLEGSFFSAEENEGKIIRPWENISTYTEYYWVKKSRKLTPYKEIYMEEIGKVHLKNETYYVFKVAINISTKNEERYKKIASYLEEKLKIILLEKKSNIFPMWPPCIKNNDGYDINKRTKVYNRVLSTNENPEIYAYRTDLKEAMSLKLNKIGDKSIVIIDAKDEEILINVDRKVTSTGVIIRKKEITNIEEKQILTDSENGKNIKGKIELNSTDDIKIDSICDITLIKVDKKGKIEQFDKKNKFEINNIKFGDKYFFFSSRNKIAEIIIKKREVESNKLFDEKNLINIIKKSQRTHFVKITPNVRKNIIANLEYIKNKEIKKILRMYLIENKIPLKMYTIMRGGK